jgi:hypothetical protein
MTPEAERLAATLAATSPPTQNLNPSLSSQHKVSHYLMIRRLKCRQRQPRKIRKCLLGNQNQNQKCPAGLVKDPLSLLPKFLLKLPRKLQKFRPKLLRRGPRKPRQKLQVSLPRLQRT